MNILWRKIGMVKWISIMVLACVLGIAQGVVADDADVILGLWLAEGGDACIQITRTEGEAAQGEAPKAQYSGKIICMEDPLYESGHALEGQPRRDSENPDPALRERPIVGLNMIEGFTYAGDLKWENGTIYDPESGRTYKCVITYVAATEPAGEGGEGEPAKLNVRGYMGVPALGRTTVWTRCDKAPWCPKEGACCKEAGKCPLTADGCPKSAAGECPGAKAGCPMTSGRACADSTEGCPVRASCSASGQ